MKNLVFLISVLTLLSCNQEGYLTDSKQIQATEKMQNLYNLNPTFNGLMPSGEDPYDCADNEGTCETGCPSFSCTRQDLDPCDYDDMGDYAQAVVCMLNKHANPPCGTMPGVPFGCEDLVTICFKNLFTPPDLIEYLNMGYINSWRYCAYADCTEYLCPSFLGDITHHLYLDTTAQNILIDYAWDLADRKKPDECTFGDAIPYQIRFMFCYDITTSPPGPTQCWEGSSTFCTNMSIKLQVSYMCCELN